MGEHRLKRGHIIYSKTEMISRGQLRGVRRACCVVSYPFIVPGNAAYQMPVSRSVIEARRAEPLIQSSPCYILLWCKRKETKGNKRAEKKGKIDCYGVDSKWCAPPKFDQLHRGGKVGRWSLARSLEFS